MSQDEQETSARKTLPSPAITDWSRRAAPIGVRRRASAA
jgi:hypothetical protein